MRLAHDGGEPPNPQTGVSHAALMMKFLADQSGATAIEYALIAAGVSVVIMTAVQGIGTTMNGKYASVSTSLK